MFHLENFKVMFLNTQFTIFLILRHFDKMATHLPEVSLCVSRCIFYELLQLYVLYIPCKDNHFSVRHTNIHRTYTLIFRTLSIYYACQYRSFKYSYHNCPVRFIHYHIVLIFYFQELLSLYKGLLTKIVGYS